MTMMLSMLPTKLGPSKQESNWLNLNTNFFTIKRTKETRVAVLAACILAMLRIWEIQKKVYIHGIKLDKLSLLGPVSMPVAKTDQGQEKRFTKQVEHRGSIPHIEIEV